MARRFLPRLLVPLSLLLSTGCAGTDVNEAIAKKQRDQPVGALRLRLKTPNPLSLLRGSKGYQLGPTDLILVSIYELEKVGERSDLKVEVDSEGKVRLPLIGSVQAEGRTANQLRKTIRTSLAAGFIRDPSVTVTVREHRSRRIAVLGAVKKAGIKSLKVNQVTVLEAIALAEGLDEKSGSAARIVRSRGTTVPVDLEALAGGDLNQNLVLEPGDALQIPEADRVVVTGFVHKPGEVLLRKRTTILEAIGLAGGIKVPAASPSLTRLRRKGPKGWRYIDVDLEQVLEGEQEDLVLRGGDVVEIRQGGFRGFALGFLEAVRGIFSFGASVAAF